MEGEIKYPVGIQDFRKLREMGYVYVDKTQFIKKMICAPRYYFLSRPRRFGKSLFLTTLEAYFEGERDLFKGLALDSDEVDWTARPVIKFSFNAVRAEEKENLDKYLETTLSAYERKYEVKYIVGDLTDRFATIIKHAKEKTGQKVAILVDEYDAILLDTLRPELADLNNYYRQTLKSLFSVLKNEDANIQLAFVTGISRFSQTSLFSGANHLKDISMLEEYDSICGITEDELRSLFTPGLKKFADKINKDISDVLALLKENYDGYHFSESCPDIYNPYSLLQALEDKKISNYWFKAATPSFLIDILKEDDFYMPSLDCIETVESDLSAKESYLHNPVSLLFESGYVTIKDFEEESAIYTLGLPNLEVAKSFTEAILPIYSGYDKDKTTEYFIRIRRCLTNGEPQRFMEELKTFLHGNPYGLTELDKREKYFQSCLYLMLRALGFQPQAEYQTCNARMDMMIQTKRFIFIFELKTNGTPQEAMDQINEKGYYLPFVKSGKQIIKIAANYSSAINNLESWLIETISN